MPGRAAAPSKRRRVDQLVVQRGLAPDLTAAAALIRAGRVYGPDRRYPQPGLQIPCDADITVRSRSRYVSRGGDKLEAALRAWHIAVSGRDCLDLGAAAGGFSDCLLQHGAAHVTAVDVGYGQLDTRLRNDPRVTSLERTHADDLPKLNPPLSPPPTLAVIDVSFIGLRRVLPSAAAVTAAVADMIALVKPQFEAPRDAVDPDGVVRNRMTQAESVSSVIGWAIQEGWRVGGVLISPLPGPAGNREWFVWLRTPDRAAR